MPETLRLEGCRSRPLAGYLKALGLLRVVARQADPRAKARWGDGTFELSSGLDREELSEFLLERYAPASVVSPWNSGAGFFSSKPKFQHALEWIEQSAEPRFALLAQAISTARGILAEHGLAPDLPKAERDAKLKHAKHDIVAALRARCPDEAVEWIDAAVVVLGSELAFPQALGGSGGLDGNFDFAGNFGQALVTVLGGGTRERSRTLLAGALHGTPTALEQLSMGFVFRDNSPVNSPSGRADGLGNPWDLMLAVEGSLVLVAGAARTHGADTERALVSPFSARPTAAGYGSAVVGEKGKAELWLPLWERWTGLRELETLVREARAQVGRRRARTGLDFVRAAGGLGVARGIDAFERYVVLERSGQSSLAVPVGRIEVKPRPAAEAISSLDRWLGQLLRYAAGDPPAAQRRAIRGLERALFTFADHPSPARAGAALEALGTVESTLAVAGKRATDARLAPLAFASAPPWLEAADDGSHEFAVARTLASLRGERLGDRAAVRDYLHGTTLDERGRRRYPDQARPAAPRRGPALDRLAAIHVARDRELAGHARRPAVAVQAFQWGLSCPLGSARRLAGGALDEERVMRLAGGLALPDFKQARRSPRTSLAATPVPTFDLLALAWQGAAAEPLAPRPGWAAQLTAGAVGAVTADACLRLRLARRIPRLEASDLETHREHGPRLAAALLLHLPPGDRDLLARRLTDQPAMEGAPT